MEMTSGKIPSPLSVLQEPYLAIHHRIITSLGQPAVCNCHRQFPVQVLLYSLLSTCLSHHAFDILYIFHEGSPSMDMYAHWQLTGNMSLRQVVQGNRIDAHEDEFGVHRLTKLRARTICHVRPSVTKTLLRTLAYTYRSISLHGDSGYCW